MGYISSVVCPVLIGRQETLARLQRVAAKARSGSGQMVLIGGEAGIGKSRLVAEFKNWALANKFILLEGACFETDTAYPYSPWLDLFRSYFTGLAASSLPENLRPVALSLLQLLPELAFIFPELTKYPAPQILEPAEEKRRVFNVMLHFLTERGAACPVLVVMEDIHWADDLSLEFLLYLARRSRNKPLLLVVTYRNDEPDPRLQQWLAQLDRERLTEEVILKQLSKNEIGAMLQGILGSARPMENDLVDLIFERSEGNPFFVEELLKGLLPALEAGKTIAAWHGQNSLGKVPRSVYEAVHQRTANLSPDARKLLTLAALNGRRFNTTLLQAVLNWNETHLLGLLKELKSTQLVVEETSERFAFRHALTQQAILDNLLLLEQQALHRRIAETLQAFSGPFATREHYLEDLAYHCFEAGMWEQAAAYNEELGEKALKLYAQQTAITYFNRAFTALKRMGHIPKTDLYLSRGKAYETIGDFEHAREDYEQARLAAREAQQYHLEWESILATGYLWTGHDYERAGEWFQKGLALSEELDNQSLRAWSLTRLGNWYLNKGQIRETIIHLEEAYRLFNELHNKQGMAETLEQLGAAHYFSGDPARGVNEYFNRVVELFREIGNNQGLFYTLAARSLDSSPETLETTTSSLRTRGECLKDLEEALQLARQVQSQSGLAFVEMCHSLVLSSFGDFGPAISHANEALEIAGAMEHQEWVSAARGALGQIYLLLLEPGQAIYHLEAAIALAETLGSVIWVKQLIPYLASAYLLNQKLEKAEPLLKKVIPIEKQPADFFERQVCRVWGLLALAQGKPSLALKLADKLIETVPGNSDNQSIPHLLALKGEALLELERYEEAARTLEEAKRGAQQRQAPSINWRIHLLLGRAYHLLKWEDLSHQEWKAGREIIKKLAATITDTTLRDNFIQTTASLFPTEKQVLPAVSVALTAREREVATLVAGGKTNREIADLLSVSERTAEAHVSNILGKLGFSTRSQIAAWVVEKGLT